jgi:hypothetical protein
MRLALNPKNDEPFDSSRPLKNLIVFAAECSGGL